MRFGNPGTWLHGEDLTGGVKPPKWYDGCGCPRALVWDGKRGYWRHLDDGTPCRARRKAQAA